MILYGPPGTGKTTLARMFAASPGWAFEEHSAVQVGLAEVRAVRERARARRDAQGQRTVFFLDEIHRFNKAQQDALLPLVEEGLLTLIGATTENPAFEVNGALLSRLRVYALDRSRQDELEEAAAPRASPSGEPGLDAGRRRGVALLAARASNGDARVALERARARARRRRCELG